MIVGLVAAAPTWWLSAKQLAISYGGSVVVAAIVAFFVFQATCIAVAFWKPRWWENKTRFTIAEGACAMSGVAPSSFNDSERAQALAVDILGGVRSGRIKVADETYSVRNIGLAMSDNPSIYPRKPDADFGELIGKATLEEVASVRGASLPWIK